MNVPVKLKVLAAVGSVLPSDGLAVVSTGASLTPVTFSEAVSLSALKSVVPPRRSIAKDRPGRRPRRGWRPRRGS